MQKFSDKFLIKIKFKKHILEKLCMLSLCAMNGVCAAQSVNNDLKNDEILFKFSLAEFLTSFN